MPGTHGETAHMLGAAIEALDRGRRVRGAGAVLGVPTSFRLKGPVVDGAPADEEDVRTTRRVLAVLGRHGLGDALRNGPMIDGPMIHGIGGLQKENGIFPTGGVRPGDRTERLIERKLREVQVDQGPAEEVLERDRDGAFESLAFDGDDDEPADEDRAGALKPTGPIIPRDRLDLDAAFCVDVLEAALAHTRPVDLLDNAGALPTTPQAPPPLPFDENEMMMDGTVAL